MIELFIFVIPFLVPLEILARGPSALEAYNKALADGQTTVRRVPIMLIGQDRAGKTSLKKSLKGICFNPEEDSTVGIEVDPSHFKVTKETWRTGTTDKEENSYAAISFDYHTARCIVDSLSKERRSSKVTIDSDESTEINDSVVTERPLAVHSTEPALGEEDIQVSQDLAPNLSRDVNLPPEPKEQNQKDANLSTPHVPEEVAAVTETVLQGDWGDHTEDIHSTMWDFAGQSVYYVTHPLFLTARAIYCLVYDLSLNPHDRAKPLVKQGLYKKYQENFNLKTNLDYLDFWMMSVASLPESQKENRGSEGSPKSEVLPERLPPVFLVCTHADTPYGGGDPRELSREIFGFLKAKPYGTHLHDVFFVDNTSLNVRKSDCPEVSRLREEVLAVAKELPYVNEAIPIKWLKFDKVPQALREEQKCISLTTAKRIASTLCNINEDKDLKTLLNYLHDLRSLIHFDDSPQLDKLVVLDPQWLIDVFKKVITVKPYDSREKKFVDLWCKLETDGLLDEKLLEHAWGTLCNDKETCESLLGIMERFSLLCPWPTATAENKNYLVPSMLKTHPPTEIVDLIASARIPSLFLTFGNSQVPPGFFPRLILQLFQWGKDRFWRPVNPRDHLFHNFARFFSSEHEDCSVIFLCHSSIVEVVVHRANASVKMAEVSSFKFTTSEEFQHDIAGINCARAVRRQLGLMLECMRNEFCWLRSMRYEMSVICPVCCCRGVVTYCPSHRETGCKQEQCLHFIPLSKLCTDKENINCTKLASAQDTRVQIMQFTPWLCSSQQKVNNGVFLI